MIGGPEVDPEAPLMDNDVYGFYFTDWRCGQPEGRSQRQKSPVTKKTGKDFFYSLIFFFFNRAFL